MKVIILTSSKTGSASVHIKKMIESGLVKIETVVFNEGTDKKKIKLYRRKLNKILKIGIWGALNGIKMRKWYSDAFDIYLKPESVEDICKKHHIRYTSTSSINSIQTVEIFKNAKPDIGISLGNGYIGSKIFNIPINGMLNIHHEQLPEYQNAQSVIWQVYNESDHTGYTIHKIDKKIDTGEILFQELIPIQFRETLADTVSYNYAKLMENSSQALVKVLSNFNKFYGQRTAQGKGNSYTTPSYKEFKRIKKNFLKLKKINAHVRD